MLTRDRAAEIRKIETTLDRVKQVIINNINNAIFENKNKVERITREWQNKVAALTENVKQKMKLLEALNPEKILRQGYAILSGKVSPGSVVKITTFKQEINAEIKDVRDRQ
jgi:exonuclease VII large subunit